MDAPERPGEPGLDGGGISLPERKGGTAPEREAKATPEWERETVPEWEGGGCALFGSCPLRAVRMDTHTPEGRSHGYIYAVQMQQF